MSIGRALKRIKERLEDPTKISVSDLIDKACTTPLSDWSKEHIQERVKALQMEVMKKRGFNRDRFFKLFFELYDAVYAPEHRAKRSFHASTLEGDCERRLFYEISGEEPSDEVIRNIGPQLQRIFDVGTWWHTYIQLMLYRAGILETAEKPVVNKELHINSRTDGILNISGRRILLEIKSMNSRTFNMHKIKPKEEHIKQAVIYAKELGLDEICFIYVNKDTSELRDFIVPVTEKDIKAPYRKIKIVLKSVKEGEAPERVCKNSFSTMATNCPFCTKCFSD